MKKTENIRNHIGQSISIKWGTSRGRDTYGYTTCVLRNQRGEKVAGCNGGGYDMRGTVIGNWLAATFPNELRAIKEKDMPAHQHWEPATNPQMVCWNIDCDSHATRYPHGTEACPMCSKQL